MTADTAAETPARCKNPDCRSPKTAKLQGKTGLCYACYKVAPKRPLTKFTHEMIEALAATVAAGTSLAQATRDAGYTPSGVQGYLRANPDMRLLMSEAQAKGKKVGSTKWPEERQISICQRIATGATLDQVAEEEGVAAPTISSAITRHADFKRRYEAARKLASTPRVSLTIATRTGPTGNIYQVNATAPHIKVLDLAHEALPVDCADHEDIKPITIAFMENEGLIEVTWTQPDQGGSWTITGLTARGGEIRDRWYS